MIRPHQILIFGGTLLLAFLLLSVWVPSENIQLGTLSLKIPKLLPDTDSQTPQYKDITDIIKFGETIDTTSNEKKPIKKKAKKNHISKKEATKTQRTDSVKLKIQQLEFPEGNDTVLYPFFYTLRQNIAQKQLIRILHYGDSQIEGDRITSFIRTQLQKRFGGYGIGMFPIIASNPASIPYNYELEGNWSHISTIDNVKRTEKIKYGTLLNNATFTGKKKLFSGDKEAEAKIVLNHSNTSNFLAQKFTRLTIYLGNNSSPLMYELKQKDSLIDADIIPDNLIIKQLSWQFSKPEKNLALTFKCKGTTWFYGISLTGETGIAMDNIPLRGSSGLDFTKSDFNFFSEFVKLLDTRLIIFQFGVNVVHNNSTNYDYYENALVQQLEYLKKCANNVPIIVIGISDVSENTDKGYQSVGNIEKIRNAQKAAAMKTGCAFWDLYTAMGGKNSMPSWVNAKIPLAQKDFTHFNPAGARIIGELFYRALISRYDEYTKRHSE